MIEKINTKSITQLNMKKRKGTALIVMLFVFCISTFAQMEVAKPDRFLPKFGIKAGLNIANFLEKDNDGICSDVYDPKIGFHAGIVVEIPLGKRFAVEPSIMVSTKGFQYTAEDSDTTYYQEYNLYYLDIPIPVEVMLEIGMVKVFAAFGPYIGIGIGGNTYDESKSGGVKFDENDDKISWGDKDGLKSLDYGLTLGFGVELKGFQLSFAYDLGLANISNYTENDFKQNNRVTRISLAYKFGLIK